MIIQNYSPVKEAYFGKSKNLIAVEALVGKILKRLKVEFKDIGKRRIDATKINVSKENKQIEALLCKEFGFKEMALHWDGGPIVNAYTVTYGLIKLIDTSSPTSPIQNGDGTYYDKSHKYLCVVNFYAGFVDAGITAEEATACILHEIGHNFVCTPIVNAVTVLEWAFVPLNIYKLWESCVNFFKNLDKGLDTVNHPERFESNHKEGADKAAQYFIRALFSYIDFNRYLDLVAHGFFRILQSLYPPLIRDEFKEFDQWINDNKNLILAKWDEYVAAVNKAKEFYKKNPTFLNIGLAFDVFIDFSTLFFYHDFATFQHFLGLQSGYSNEVFADSFASAYGYGAATVALQRRLEYYTLNNRALAKANEYNVYNQYIRVMADIMMTFLDEHPSSQTRMKNQINKLKRDLASSDLDPRVRKELMKDLERSEALYNEYLTKFPPKLKHLAVIMNFNQINEMYFGGKFDLREPINRVLNFGKAEA